MNAFMIDYYYQFLHERHYFECHELLEEVWKAKNNFSKQDIEVAFIMLATSQYHYRRGNVKGAATCLTKAINGFKNHRSLLNSYGVNASIIDLLEKSARNIVNPYVPLQLPLTTECLETMMIHHPDFDPYQPVNSDYIDFHRTRDRSSIIAERAARLMRNKYPVKNPPADCEDE
ncbi:DUF309 domain-containing protein [Macrococcus lamae]|uniref:DUF309 domain-containing protein n=1 Tax=Macrococcus lamae TaxID=198484 RepID=A0A4R6BXE4_9STAP|nr:DUF309 domain-containing protein [Macrococcus lamae]TDM13189.1 DUF309 domain-containing protein [Macrococcus lamae]